MRKIVYFLLFAFLISKTSNAQNFIYIGEKSYKSSKTSQLTIDDGHERLININFTKEYKKPLVILSTIFSPNSTTTVKPDFGKDLFFYLEDGSVVKLQKNGDGALINNMMYTRYFIAKSDIDNLCKVNINAIGYKQIWDDTEFKKSYTASNKNKTDFITIVKSFYNE